MRPNRAVNLKETHFSTSYPALRTGPAHAVAHTVMSCLTKTTLQPKFLIQPALGRAPFCALPKHFWNQNMVPLTLSIVPVDFPFPWFCSPARALCPTSICHCTTSIPKHSGSFHNSAPLNNNNIVSNTYYQN